MQPSAFVRPLRPTVLRALRVLTRLAMAALVLTLTFGGATAATAGPAVPAAFPPHPATTVPAGVPAVPAGLPTVRPVVEPARTTGHVGTVAQPARHPAAAPAPAAVRSATAAVRLRPALPATAPGHGPLGLRGPPHA